MPGSTGLIIERTNVTPFIRPFAKISRFPRWPFISRTAAGAEAGLSYDDIIASIVERAEQNWKAYT